MLSSPIPSYDLFLEGNERLRQSLVIAKLIARHCLSAAPARVWSVINSDEDSACLGLEWRSSSTMTPITLDFKVLGAEPLVLVKACR